MSPSEDRSSDDDWSDFWIDEEPLRDWILKAYHEFRGTTLEHESLLQSIRQLLSGPPGGPSFPAEYFFQQSPETEIAEFSRGMNDVFEGLHRTVYEPLIAAVAEKEAAKEEELAPNLSLYVASLSGPISLKTRIDETLVCALISAALLTLARLGRKNVGDLLTRVS